MSLREKVQRFLEHNNQRKQTVVDQDTPDQEWSEIREGLPDSVKRILEKHERSITALEIKEIDLYRMLMKFEFMENVLDSQISVLMERQKTFNDGDWHSVGQLKP